MPVTLFIQEHSGDFNLEKEYTDRDAAERSLMHFEDSGGYWIDEGTVYVPWHRVDFARIDEVE
jgi:hypothetical protein